MLALHAETGRVLWCGGNVDREGRRACYCGHAVDSPFRLYEVIEV